MIRRSLTVVVLFLIGIGAVTACGDDSTVTADQTETIEGTDAGQAAGVRLVTPPDAEEIRSDSPPNLVTLDVRTPEEFVEGHLEGATMLDFYRPDFADQLAELDPDVPYVLYCRSGNRSGQTAALMAELGFDDVAEIEGGILAWQANGLPVAR